MTIQVKGPDGAIVQFPDGTDTAVMEKAMREHYATQAPTETAPQQPSMMQQVGGMVSGLTPMGIAQNLGNAVMHPQDALQKADDSVRMLANGASFGFADKAAGYMNGSGTEAERLRSTQAKERLGPLVGSGLEIAGSMLPATKLINAGVTATRLPMIGKLLGSSIDASAIGGLSAAGNDTSITQGMGLGAIAGAGGQLVGSALASALSKIPKQLTVDELKAVAKNSYDKADSLGIVYKPDAIKNVANDIHAEFADFGYHPDLHQGAKVALGELERLAANGNVNLKGLETARKIASNAYIPMNKANNALVGKVIKKIDDFAMNAKPSDVVMGNSADAAAALKNARTMWHRASKLDLVDTLVSKAETRAGSTGSGGNVENATRQNLRKILDSEAKSRGFTADEKAALTNAVMGSKVQNTLRQAGKFSPIGNGLIATLQALAALGGHAAGVGPAAPLIVGGAVVGTGAKFASEAMQRGAVSRLQSLISAGGDASSIVPQITPERAKLIQQLSKALMIGGASMGGQ